MNLSDSQLFPLALRAASAFAILEFLCALFGIMSLVRKGSLENAVSSAIIWLSRFSFSAKRVMFVALSNNHLSPLALEDSPSMTFT